MTVNRRNLLDKTALKMWKIVQNAYGKADRRQISVSWVYFSLRRLGQMPDFVIFLLFQKSWGHFCDCNRAVFEIEFKNKKFFKFFWSMKFFWYFTKNLSKWLLLFTDCQTNEFKMNFWTIWNNTAKNKKFWKITIGTCFDITWDKARSSQTYYISS